MSHMSTYTMYFMLVCYIHASWMTEAAAEEIKRSY